MMETAEKRAKRAGGRKPVHLTMTTKKPGGRQAIWEAIRRLGDFDVPQLAAACKAHQKTVQDYVDCLFASGHVALVDRPEAGMMFSLIRDVGVEAPRVRADGSPVTQGLPREQMWRTMRNRSLGDFDYRDLALWASTDDVAVSAIDAGDYVKHLFRAGYLILAAPAKLGKKPCLARYRFDMRRDTGPKPPMVQRMKTVFDPNERKIVWFPEVEE
jgi:hypothetical protein